MADVARISELQLDFRLYPRDALDPANVQSLADALDMGAKLPPIVARRGTGQVIDGFHRVHAVRERHSAEADIAVEWRDYETDADAFEDAIRLNATHGLRLRPLDHEVALARARKLGVTPEAVSRALKIPIARLVTKPRTSDVRKASAQVPSPSKREAWQVADDRHHAAIGQALIDLSGHIATQGERGPGDLPNVMRELSERRKAGEPLRDTLIEAAALFVCWAARERRVNGVAA